MTPAPTAPAGPSAPRLDALLAWYATLAPQDLGAIPQLYTEQARFKDPFNEVSGHAAIHRIFAHMFETTERPRFEIVEQGLHGHAAFVTWRFHFGLRGRLYRIDGASHLHFAPDGRVADHRDYWDPAEELWQKLPLLGPPVRWLRRRFTVPMR